MKKNVLFLLTLSLSLCHHNIYAEEPPAASPSPVESIAPATAEPVPVIATTPVALPDNPLPTTETSVQPVVAELAASVKSTENLEFVSGEITAMDEAAKTITVKLYGETENNANDKILTIKLDETTDITDGEKDRDIKSLTNGTEVDVEYDPATNKSTYIFVY